MDPGSLNAAEVCSEMHFETTVAGPSPVRMPNPPDPAKLGAGMGPNQLVLEFLGLADALSRRYRAAGNEAEDLQQVARLGLVKAARRYREAGNHGFVAFAVPTITGELKRYLRDHSWVVRPPRTIQEARLAVRRVRPELTQRLGREPSATELSLAAGISELETSTALLAETAMVAHQIDQDGPPTGDDGRGQAVILAAEDPAYERVEQRLTLEAALRGVSGQERRLLHLRFVLELPQGQIAQEFGVSQMQVSRLLRALIERLGRRLAEPVNL